jgi:hypothetical protein
MMDMVDIGRILASGVGPELVQTLKRIAKKQGMGVDEVMRQSLTFTQRMETLSTRSGKSVKQVADRALDLFEGELR